MSKKNILFYFTWQLKPVHHGIVMDKLDDICKDPEVQNIFFITCSGALKPCYTNREAEEKVCDICRLNTQAALKPYKSKVKHISLRKSIPEQESFEYNNVGEIKKIEYLGVKIGYGALSSYISFTRNLEPLMDADFRKYFDRLLSYQVYLTNFLKAHLEKENIDEVYFFNGRTADTRPLYDLCVNQEIEFKSLEMIKEQDDKFYINEFPNCLPHDIAYHNLRIEELWRNSKKGEAETIGKSFFENRRSGILTRDRKVYTTNQEANSLPNDWDKAKQNIVIFNSSEDEFVAIGDIFESKALFENQEEGLRMILSRYNNFTDFHFYLRIHPNLSDIKYKYHRRLQNLENEFSNITVIPAKSSVSSYELLDSADKIITFGSTMGVEACYWNKPAILLAGSFYYYLDVVYKPKNKEELFALIENEVLESKPQIEAVKFGYYMMNYKSYTRSNSNEPQTMDFLGIRFGYKHKHLKLFGSEIIFKLVDKLYRLRRRFFSKKQINLPFNEA